MAPGTGSASGGAMKAGDLEDQAGRLLAGMLLAVVRGMVHAGVEPAKAMRLAAFAVLEAEFGRDTVLALGMPGTTERRWRRELREALAEAEIPEDPPVELINELLPMMGITGVELRAKE